MILPPTEHRRTHPVLPPTGRCTGVSMHLDSSASAGAHSACRRTVTAIRPGQSRYRAWAEGPGGSAHTPAAMRRHGQPGGRCVTLRTVRSERPSPGHPGWRAWPARGGGQAPGQPVAGCPICLVIGGGVAAVTLRSGGNDQANPPCPEAVCAARTGPGIRLPSSWRRCRGTCMTTSCATAGWPFPLQFR